MAKLSQRTLGIIEHMHSRGISAVSIAGETSVRLDRVQAAIAEIERRKNGAASMKGRDE